MARVHVPQAKSEDCKAWGRQFRLAREQAGLTLSAAVEATGLHLNTIRWHEGGARMLRLDDLVKCARTFGVPLHALTNIGARPEEN